MKFNSKIPKKDFLQNIAYNLKQKYDKPFLHVGQKKWSNEMNYQKLDLFEAINPFNVNHGSVDYKNYLSEFLLIDALR